MKKGKNRYALQDARNVMEDALREIIQHFEGMKKPDLSLYDSMEQRGKSEPPSVLICHFSFYLSHFSRGKSAILNSKQLKTGIETAKNGQI